MNPQKSSYRPWYLLALLTVCSAVAIIFLRSPKVNPSDHTASRGQQHREQSAQETAENAVGHKKRREVEDEETRAERSAARLAAALISAQKTSATPTGYAEFDAFNTWTLKYLGAGKAERGQLIAEGLVFAEARRGALSKLIQSDPRLAIENAVPPVVRQELPMEVAQLLEERFNEEAYYCLLGVMPESDGEKSSSYRRTVRTDDRGSYEVSTYGARISQKTTKRASIVGIAVDNKLAVDERPLRIVEPGEIPNHPNNLTRNRTVRPLDERGFALAKSVDDSLAPAREIVETCPISGDSTTVPTEPDGKAAPITPDEVVVEAGGQFHVLCSGGHILGYEERLILQEGGNGGPSGPTNAPNPTQSTGYKTNLFMRVVFPEALKPALSEKGAYDLGKAAQDWFTDASYGAVSFMTTVTPVIVLPRTEAWYKQVCAPECQEMLDDAKAASKLAGFDPANYNFETVSYTGGPGSFGGQAVVGDRQCWLKTNIIGLATHEYGHNFGLYHANLWGTTNGSVIGAGSEGEYNDPFDSMGHANSGAGDKHYSAYQKNRLSWLPTPVVHEVSSSGMFRIFPMDQSALDPNLRYGIKVTKDAKRNYWVDLRQKFVSNAWVQNGVFLHWDDWTTQVAGPELLDTTPGSPDGANDAALVIGRTFSDDDTGIYITPVAKISTTPASMDVVVNIGTFPGNLAPIVAVEANTTTAGTGTPINFTATASDPDGDTLSYAWDFGDKSFSNTNSSTVSKSWTSAGEYRVRCTVSDMKGKIASSSVIVTVGSPSTFRIDGTITEGGQPLHNVRVHNGLSGANYREACTDTDGTYTLVGLAAGSYTIDTQLYSYTIVPTGSAVITVGPNATDVNFTSTTQMKVSIAALDPSCTEDGDTGTFRISRVGPISAALAVTCYMPAGTARRGSDYTLSPAAVATTPINFEKYTIPAGQSYVDITVTALTDSTTESYESVILDIFPISTYICGNTTATVLITDANTTNPLVQVKATDRDADEDGDPAQFSIERIGSTADALTVPISMSGTAINGVDYQSIPSTVIIPAGQSSVAVDIVPLQDSIVEPLETIYLTIGSSSEYVRPASSSSYTGIVNLHDDDRPTLTIAATDNTASESGNNPGEFTITRTGDTTLPLTVNYGVTGSALHGTDYKALPGILIIPSGSSSAKIVITPINDDIGEPSQTVELQIRSSLAYAVGNPDSAVVTILDDGDLPYATIDVTNGPAIEGGANGTFTITTSGSGTGNITVRYAVSGTATNGVDYNLLSGSVSMGRNATSNISIATIQDAFIEGYETIQVTLLPDPIYSLAIDSSALMILQDDDATQVSVSITDETFTETNGSLAKFFLSRTGATTSALTVNYQLSGTATEGLDYTSPSGSVIIPAGKAGAFVSISMLADTLAEGDETIVLNVVPNSNYSAGLGSAELYIKDKQSNSLPITVGFESTTGTYPEDVGMINIPVKLSAASTNTITVEYYLDVYTAVGGGVDFYFTPGKLTFAPGETMKTIPVNVRLDTLTEGNEEFNIMLKNAYNAKRGNGVHILTITDVNPTDVTPPSVIVSSAVQATKTSPIVFAFNFSEPVTGLTASGITVTGGTKGTFAGSGAAYTLSVTPSAQGNVTCQVNANAALDNAGNANLASDTASVIYDTVAPTIAISSPSLASTSSGPVSYTVTYADLNFNTSTLVPANVTLIKTGTANGTVSVTGSDNTRTVTISQITGEGTLKISIASNTANDLAGNNAPASAQSDDFIVVSGYNDWSAGVDFTADTSGDGIPNGVAWALGATSSTSNATALLPTVDAVSSQSYLIFTYRRSDVANASATIVAQYSSSLSGNWTSALHDGTDVIITEIDNFYGSNPGIDKVEVKINRSLAIECKIFTRLKVTPNP